MTSLEHAGVAHSDLVENPAAVLGDRGLRYLLHGSTLLLGLRAQDLALLVAQSQRRGTLAL